MFEGKSIMPARQDSCLTVPLCKASFMSDRGKHHAPLVLHLSISCAISSQAARCFVSLRACHESIAETAQSTERAAMSEAVSGLAAVFPHSAAGRSDAVDLAGCWLHGSVRSEGADEQAGASGMRSCGLVAQQAREGDAGGLAQGCSECHREALEDCVERVGRAREAKLDLALLHFWHSL